MTDINLAAIRARDTVTMETLPELERLAMTMEDEEMRAAILLVTDRHALLGYVDELREAAGNVTCLTCGNTGRASLKMPGSWGAWTEADCPDCADLRRLLGEKT